MTWEAEARITADVSVQHTNRVEVGRKALSGTGTEKARETSSRPAFDLSVLTSDFVAQFAQMASASSTVWGRTYESKPSLRQIALDFVDEELGTGWVVGTSKWPSRWTPEGWAPSYAGDPGATYTLTAAGGPPGAPYILMRRNTSRRHFYLQFYVSVDLA